MKNASLLLLFAALTFNGKAQKKIMMMGSSTTAGYAATSFDSSWAGRLQAWYRKNTSTGNPDTIFYNLGITGYTTYQEMPTGYVPPAGRPLPDPRHNVTRALEVSPDIIIINLPSNDIASFDKPEISPAFSIKEIMDNFRLMYKTITDKGVKCFITTTQPRNDLTDLQRVHQHQLADSIRKVFGNQALNFWDDLVTTDGKNRLRDEIRHIGFFDSAYHLNNLGHKYLFQKTMARNIFATSPQSVPPPFLLSNFSGELQNNAVTLRWHSANEENTSTYYTIQRSANGQSYSNLFTQTGKGGNSADYSWTDRSPLTGKNMYRIEILRQGEKTYSPVIEINNSSYAVTISQLMINGSNLVVTVQTQKNQKVTASIIDMQGNVLEKQTVYIYSPASGFNMPIGDLKPGNYILNILTPYGFSVSKTFTKP